MAAFSNFLETSIINSTLRGVAWPTITAPIMVSLHTGDPGEDGTANEVVGGSYARQNATFDAPTDGATSNSATIRFDDMPAVTVTHVAIWDSSGTPQCLYVGALSASKTLTAGDPFEFAAGALDISAS